MSAFAARDFSAMFRYWRTCRKMSQLDLALTANVSQRHVSWLETGRSQPSREMVVRLAEALDIPLRERNTLLQSAGYAALYSETRLDEPVMAPVTEVLNRVLQHHEPLPAIVVDRLWNIRQQNASAAWLFSQVIDTTAILRAIGNETDEKNLALLTVHPLGLRQFITNWEQVCPAFVRRLNSEARASGDPRLQRRFARYVALAGPHKGVDQQGCGLLPVLPLELKMGALELSLFSIISTFGTPQDITTDELRIEAFYPTDIKTKEFFRDVAKGASPAN